MKFSFSKTASTLSLAALGVAAATSAQAAIASINVEVAKVTLFQNASTAVGNGVVVFDSVNNIGGSETVTVDLLSASDASGKSVPLRNLTADEAGVYRTAVIEVVNFQAEDDTAGTTIKTPITLAGAGTDPLSGNAVFVLGDHVATGATTEVSDIFGSTGALASMKPIATAGGTFTLPTLDVQVPAKSVVDDGAGSATFTQLPVFSTVAKATTADDATARDYAVTITGANLTTAFGDAAKAETTETLTVGLFGATGLVGKAIAAETFDVTYAATTGDIADDAAVTFVDASYGTHNLVVWLDTNKNSMVDAGEKFSSESTTDITAGAVAFAATDVTATAPDVVTSAAVAKLAATLAANATMPAKSIDVVLPLDNETTTDVKDVIELTLANSGDLTGETAPATGTVTLTLGAADFDLPITWNAAIATYAADEVIEPVIAAGATTTITTIPGAAYTTESLTLTVPFTAITGVDANGATGTAPTLDIAATAFIPSTGLAATITTGSVADVAGMDGAVANGEYTSAGVLLLANTDVALAE